MVEYPGGKSKFICFEVCCTLSKITLHPKSTRNNYYELNEMTENISSYPVFFSYLAVYARWIVGTVLLVAGVAKAQVMGEFVLTIQAFRVVPKQLSQVVAPLIISLELILGLSLLLGVGVQLATITAAFLFGGFTVTILVNLVRHNILDCNCFGPFFKEKISAKAFIRNLVFIILCLWNRQYYDGYLALDSWFFGRAAIQNHSFESFFLLTAAIMISGISILIARTVLKNFKSVASKSIN